MVTKAQVSAKTASGDTVKTLVDTVTIPQGVTRIIGVWAYGVGGAGSTTLENVTGIMEYDSDDLPIVPLQLPLDCVVVLTSGTAAFQPRIIPVDIPVVAGARIRGYVTMDMVLTVAYTCRFGFIYG